ncbi:hypothetical protein HCH_00097 [Hahella chejuensis KCTC 2396]|uniref:Uncharacterized protein n=1 Tax=Hahella chejuensis (strain KCTC 2396) TaxID=349521 RepID=Q2SQQ6_HAHCH|nr:hypothetical protein [Hahella chejuensis]ABC27018.1 hypothetical protein HCH_00097 [Hahella chejuensis KCTC 2396]
MSDTTNDVSASTPPQTRESDRRAFLRNAALVTGAASIASFSSAATAATDSGVSRDRKTVSASFDPQYEVSIWDLQNILEQILNQSGCPTCGLVGLDLRLGLDPVVKIQSKIPVNVTLYGG